MSLLKTLWGLLDASGISSTFWTCSEKCCVTQPLLSSTSVWAHASLLLVYYLPGTFLSPAGRELGLSGMEPPALSSREGSAPSPHSLFLWSFIALLTISYDMFVSRHLLFSSLHEGRGLVDFAHLYTQYLAQYLTHCTRFLNICWMTNE